MSISKSLRRTKSMLPTLSTAAALFMLWTSLRLLTNCSQPIFVVSSESMEPTFYRGDVILLSNLRQNIQVGDIPVVWFQGRPLPMVHRAVKIAISAKQDGSGTEYVTEQQVLTKGDNNEVDDTALYPEGRSFVRREEVVGLVWGYVPFVGRISLVVQEHRWIVYALFGLVFLLNTPF